MQITITGRRGVIALLLILAVGALALVASTAITSAAGVDLESAASEQALPESAISSAVSDHCGGAGDLALLQTTSADITSVQSLSQWQWPWPGGPCVYVSKCIPVPESPGGVVCYEYIWCP